MGFSDVVAVGAASGSFALLFCFVVVPLCNFEGSHEYDLSSNIFMECLLWLARVCQKECGATPGSVLGNRGGTQKML